MDQNIVCEVKGVNSSDKFTENYQKTLQFPQLYQALWCQLIVLFLWPATFLFSTLSSILFSSAAGSCFQ